MKKHTYFIIFATFIVAIFFSCSSDDGTSEETPTTPITGFQGEIEWLQTLGGSEEDTAQDITMTSDGGYAIVGFTKSINGDITDNTSEQNDYWVARMDTNGNLLWSKTYGGTADDRGEAIKTTSDGGFIITGYSRSNDEDVTTNNGFYDHWIVKLDANGDLIWEKSFGFSGSDQSFDIIQTNDGGYFTTGFLDITASGGQGSFGKPNANNGSFTNPEHGVGEYWCHKLDANGTIIWSRYFGGTNNDRSYATLETNDNNFIIAGSSESDDFDVTNSQGSYDFWVVKVNAEGTKIWEKSYGGTETDVGYAIASDGNGRYLIVGDVRSNDGDVSIAKGNGDLWMIQIDGNGNLIWEKSLGGTEFDTGRGIYPTQSGGFVIAGNSRSNDQDVDQNNGGSDIWTVLIDNNGNVIWKGSMGGSEDESATGALETTDKKIIIVGRTDSDDGDISEHKGLVDAVVIKYK